VDPRHCYLKKYTQSLFKFVGMPLWVVRISDKPPTPVQACCMVDVEDYQEALIYVGHEFWDLNPLEKTQALLHEVNHCPIGIVHEDFKAALETVMGEVPKARREATKGHMKIHLKSALRKEEAYVNTLAVVMAPFAPPWLQG